MKRFALTFSLLTGLLFVLAQCGAADAGAKTADQFFATIVKGDLEKAAAMVELPLGDTTNLIPQLQQLRSNPVNGQLKSFKKSMGFNTNASNGVTTVELPYVLTYEQGTQNFNVVIQNRGQGYKILSVR